MTSPDPLNPRIWPPTSADLASLIGTVDTSDGALRQMMIDAAVDHVRSLPQWAGKLVDGQPCGSGVWAGTALLAARLVTRRHSLAGVATFGDMGAAYVTRTDPDIARLLRLGYPAVG